MIIYEPTISEDSFESIPVIRAIEDFKSTADVIIANRHSEELDDVIAKVYTRDLFARD